MVWAPAAAWIEGPDVGGEETLMTGEALIEEINVAYRRLSATVEDLARADRELAEHVRKVRLDNAEAILGARNESTARLYLDGLLDTEDHRRLETNRARAELDLLHAAPHRRKPQDRLRDAPPLLHRRHPDRYEFVNPSYLACHRQTKPRASHRPDRKYCKVALCSLADYQSLPACGS
jgi:hypothetical protein